jgi:hypothetical protein
VLRAAQLLLHAFVLLLLLLLLLVLSVHFVAPPTPAC